MASRLPAESDRAVDAPERVARPQTTVAPTPAVDGKRTRPTPSRRAEAARPKAQKQTETGRPTRTPGTSSTLGSLGGSERHGGAVAEAMPALRREPAAKARPGAYGR